MHLYLGQNPRTLYLITSAHEEKQGCPHRALIFRAAETASQVVVEFLPGDEVSLSNAVRMTTRIVKGCLGLISVENGLIPPSGALSMPERVARIHEVRFYCLTSSAWDDFSTSQESLVTYEGVDVAMNREPFPSTASPPILEHPLRLARGPSAAHDVGVFDDRFIWNEYVVRSLLDFREKLDLGERQDLDRCQFIVLAIQGYVGVSTMALPAPPVSGSPVVVTLSLISRLGRKRAGTRFNTRGVDDDGNTANFVETETILSTDQHCMSYTQIRGSVPLFWEQQGIQTFGQRIQITRPHASQPAFERHFAHLIETYGAVHAINLLGSKENEATLTAAYASHLNRARNLWGDQIGITHYDFHYAVKMAGHDNVIRDIEYD
ncbi:hypothetical protein ID866_3984 [Astraeus odoratus]|nr:hypothetical protein ID866_3984 [Astraeus odoratus]